MNSRLKNEPPQSPLIVVFGCTGTVGVELMRQLAAQECSIRGILRQPNRSYPVSPENQRASVSYVTADHGSPKQLLRACQGAFSIFLLVGTCPEQVPIEMSVIEAARQVGVQRIIKLSAPVVEEPASVEVSHWHRKIEKKLVESGLEYCSLRPYAFMQNWLRNTHTIRHFGKIIGSAGESPRNYVDCRDVASIAAQLLLTPDPLPHKALTIKGPEAISNQEVANRLTLVTGSKVKYQNLSRSAHQELLEKRAKLPNWLAQHIVELEELARKIPEQPSDMIQQFLGRAPRTMDEFLQESRLAFARKPIWKFW